MRHHLAAAILALACGCARQQAAAWVPQLVVRGQLAEDDSARTTGEARSMDWRVEAALRFDLDRGPEARDAVPRVGARPSTSSACAHAATCAWEQRERARALAEGLALARNGGE